MHVWSSIPYWSINPGRSCRNLQQGFNTQIDTAIFCIVFLSSQALTWAPALLQPTSIWFTFHIKKSVSYSAFSSIVYNWFVTQGIWVSVTVIQGWHAAGIGTTGQGHLLTIPDALQHSNRTAQEHPHNCVPSAGSHFPLAMTVKLISVGYYPGQNCAKNSPEAQRLTAPLSVLNIFLALNPNPSIDDKSNKKLNSLF